MYILVIIKRHVSAQSWPSSSLTVSLNIKRCGQTWWWPWLDRNMSFDID